MSALFDDHPAPVRFAAASRRREAEKELPFSEAPDAGKKENQPP